MGGAFPIFYFLATVVPSRLFGFGDAIAPSLPLLPVRFRVVSLAMAITYIQQP